MSRYRKLSGVLVREIRARWLAGAYQKDLAADYGLALQTVAAIVHGHIWANVSDEAPS